jgi:hypothetical protein
MFVWCFCVQIENIFFTCVALHNIIHSFDGRDVWECGACWGGGDGLFEDDLDRNWARPLIRRKDGSMVPVADGEDFSRIGSIYFGPSVQVPAANRGAMRMNVKELVDLNTESDAGFSALQAKLVRNFQVRKSMRTVHWVRSSKVLGVEAEVQLPVHVEASSAGASES